MTPKVMSLERYINLIEICRSTCFKRTWVVIIGQEMKSSSKNVQPGALSVERQLLVYIYECRQHIVSANKQVLHALNEFTDDRAGEEVRCFSQRFFIGSNVFRLRRFALLCT